MPYSCRRVSRYVSIIQQMFDEDQFDIHVFCIYIWEENIYTGYMSDHA